MPQYFRIADDAEEEWGAYVNLILEVIGPKSAYQGDSFVNWRQRNGIIVEQETTWCLDMDPRLIECDAPWLRVVVDEGL